MLSDILPQIAIAAFMIIVVAIYFGGAIHQIRSGRRELSNTQLPRWRELRARAGIIFGWILIVWAGIVLMVACTELLRSH
jgi:hypothetical protein